MNVLQPLFPFPLISVSSSFVSLPFPLSSLTTRTHSYPSTVADRGARVRTCKRWHVRTLLGARRRARFRRIRCGTGGMPVRGTCGNIAPPVSHHAVSLVSFTGKGLVIHILVHNLISVTSRWRRMKWLCCFKMQSLNCRPHESKQKRL